MPSDGTIRRIHKLEEFRSGVFSEADADEEVVSGSGDPPATDLRALFEGALVGAEVVDDLVLELGGDLRSVFCRHDYYLDREEGEKEEKEVVEMVVGGLSGVQLRE